MVVTPAKYSVLCAETALNEGHYRLIDVESRIRKSPVGKLRRTRRQINRLIDLLSVRSYRGVGC